MSTLRPAGGLLLAAVQNNDLAPIQWVTVDAGGGLQITVSADALMGSVPEVDHPIRLPASYQETIAICKQLNCIAPTAAFSDAIWKAAAARPQPVPLVRTADEARNMATVEFTIRHNANVDKTEHDDGALVADVGKDWVIDNGIAVKGAVNYGWRTYDKSNTPKTIQSLGHQHDAGHYDYSQILRVVQRTALLNGDQVDLLDYLGKTINAKFLAPYR